MNEDESAVKSPATPLDSAPSGATQSHPPPQIPDHELLRRIGLGSYGEVWLARSVIGTYRAVKVVYRDRFENERPYEREYSGIQKFEPISRTHEGMVDILQIGRNDRDGYFYYVMELADDEGVGQSVPAAHSNNSGETSGDRRDACPTFDPTAYTPKTIRTEISRRGRLPCDECLQLSLSLTSALGHLHKAGLVHRDIKPSNIIFVNGAPKLADIGLVTDAGDAKSFVGTEGFIPPEGPGTAQADIYSLGKVLYEIATGKDRQSFPEPPTLLEQFTDRKQLLELNEIILKACENDPRKRYRTAEDMHEELELLQFGKSVKRLRIVERRLVHARSVGLAAAGVAVLAILTVFLFAYRSRIERDSRKRVEQALNRAEAAEQAARGESYANAMLLGHEALQENNFGLVRDLLDQTRSFASDTGTTNVGQPIPAWEWRHLQYETRDEAAYLFAQCASRVNALDVSPDSQWLVAGEKSGRILLWRLPTRDLAGEWQTDGEVQRLAFSPDSRRLAIGCTDGLVRVLTVPSGAVLLNSTSKTGFLTDAEFLTCVSQRTAPGWRSVRLLISASRTLRQNKLSNWSDTNRRRGVRQFHRISKFS